MAQIERGFVIERVHDALRTQKAEQDGEPDAPPLIKFVVDFKWVGSCCSRVGNRSTLWLLAGRVSLNGSARKCFSHASRQIRRVA